MLFAHKVFVVYNIEGHNFYESARKMTKTSISIAIVGGGASGLAFAQTVAKEFSSSKVKVEVTLFEKQEYYYNVFGSLRALVDTSYVPKMFIPYDNALPKNGPAKIKRAIVSHIDYNSKAVTYSHLSGSSSIMTYDYLVLATGSSYPSPIKPDPAAASILQADMEASILQTAQRIKGAKRILVIGGGAVGCEMAGELKSHYPDKKVMLLDSHDELLSSQDAPNIRAPLEDALQGIGVELYLGQTLTDRFSHHQFGTKTLTMKSGMTIESDVRLLCAGMKPNISLMMKHPECLDDNGKFIKVKPTMQVDHPDYEDVYVLGDCSNHPTPKMGYWGTQQGHHLGKALAVHIKSGGTKDVKPFKAPGTETLLIPVGPNGGRSQLPMFGGIIMKDFFTRMVKSKDLMAGMTWGNLNAKMPKDEVEPSCFPCF